MTVATSHRERIKPGPKISERYPLLALEEVLQGGDARMRQEGSRHHYEGLVLPGYISIVCNVNVGTVHRWRKEGLTPWAADEAAVAIGYHPSMIWPEWATEESEESCQE